jgi:hypothetical protein
MIIHCTQKLAKNLKDVSPTPLAETSLLGSWHANIHTIDSRKCVMFCHDATRYVLFMAGLKKPDFMELGAVHRKLFLEALAAQGFPAIQVKKVELALGPAVFDTATDRSVLGSLNQARSDFEWGFCATANVMELKPVDIAIKLNHRPTQANKVWLWPDQAMSELISTL